MSRENIIAVAAAQDGIKESPAGSNKTKFGEWYGLNGVKWCAIFVSYVYDHAGHHMETIDTANGYQSCQSGYNYWKRNNRLTKDPQPGDVVLYDWGGDGVCDHTGIFVKWLDAAQTTFQAWEGNTEKGNDSDGGKVMLRERKKSLVRAFATPKAISDTPPAANSELLESGDKGSDVAALQKMLFDLGFKITVDGIFGNETTGIIKDFQKKNNLSQTGTVTPELFGMIQEEVNMPNVSNKKITTGSYIRKGDSGTAVLLIQQALNSKNTQPKLEENGVFDSTTLTAVKAFQQQNALDVDGIVGPATFAALGITNV
ncbi:MAG: peptidoglycan-binding protein [Chitinophagaceae bacterium]